jgi:hypothetical protein
MLPNETLPVEPPAEALKRAINLIADDIFKNGPEEGCRIMEDYNHPLHQAIQILMNVKMMVDPVAQREVAMLIEEHRRAEENR